MLLLNIYFHEYISLLCLLLLSVSVIVKVSGQAPVTSVSGVCWEVRRWLVLLLIVLLQCHPVCLIFPWWWRNDLRHYMMTRSQGSFSQRQDTSVQHEMNPEPDVFRLFAQRPTRWKPSAWLRTKKVNAVPGCMPELPNTGSAVPWNRPLHLVPTPFLITCL